MAAVALEHISKVYPTDVWAVRDLSLDVADGELLVLVGPSGCGKTTTLRLIAGLEQPTAGRIRIAKQDVTELPPRNRDVAMAFQRHALYPHLSVRRNLAFGLELRASGPLDWLQPRRRAAKRQLIDGRVADAARLLELEHLLDRRPAQLSGGQQQRVALGRALVRQPTVFLLDEPLSHLDVRLRTEMRRQLHLLHRRLHGTIIHVTHDPVEAMTLADRVVVLDRGELQQIGPPAEVYDRPVNRRVAGFFGWPPMNLLDGTLTALDGSAWFRARDGALTLKVTPPQGVQPGQAVSLGIRPENVRIVGIGSKIDHGPCCRMRVAQVELLGGDSLVTLEWCGQRITCRLPSGQSAQEGQEVDVMLPMNCTHWFDDVTDRALQRGERTG